MAAPVIHQIDPLTEFAGEWTTELAEIYLPAEGGSPLVPVAGSEAAAAVAQRIADYRAAYAALGISAIAEGAGPVHAAPVTIADLQRVVEEEGFGYGYAPLRSRSHYGIGDVELGAKFLLFDGFGDDAVASTAFTTAPRFRASLLALARLGTARTDDPDDLLDLGIGDGQHDVEVGVVGDVAIGRAFVSASARYGV